MADKIDATEQFLTTLNNAMNSVGKAMADIAPDVAKATLVAIQVSGIANLVMGILSLVGCVYFCRLVVKLSQEPWMGRNAEPTKEGGLAIACMCAAIVFGMGAAGKLVCDYYWVSAFSPEAGLAYKILEKVL